MRQIKNLKIRLSQITAYTGTLEVSDAKRRATQQPSNAFVSTHRALVQCARSIAYARLAAKLSGAFIKIKSLTL